MIHFVINMVLVVLTHMICYAAMTEWKYPAVKSAVIYLLFGVYFIGMSVMTLLLVGLDSPYTVLIAFSGTILAAFVVFSLTSSDPFCKKVFLFVSYSVMFCIFFCISDLIKKWLFPGLSGYAGQYARNGIRFVLYIPFILVYLRFLRPVIREVPAIKKKTWYSISLVSLIFLIIFARFVAVFYNGGNGDGHYIFLFFAVTVIYASVLWVIFETVRYMSRESRMELVSKNVEYLQGQLALSKENELSAKTMRHDIRHHNQNIVMLLKKGDIGEALRYIEQYNESIEAARPAEYCPHTTVNAILNNFCARAQKEGIPVSVSADTREGSAIADMDFVAILSNLLENALNGFKTCGSDGEIKVNIRTVAAKTVIVCSNPCTPELKIENGMIKQKGTGIDSIVLAVRRYNGDISYKLEDGILTVCVILNAAYPVSDD
ncbi:MAG TPA: GHKL domain-containing protein [Candidatus Mediterraneibacter merdavium]|nr:GHKL domain-containing protein [Candidatus Mediterraneibacter merdavium]